MANVTQKLFYICSESGSHLVSCTAFNSTLTGSHSLVHRCYQLHGFLSRSPRAVYHAPLTYVICRRGMLCGRRNLGL